MAVEKTRLVQISGPISLLNRFLTDCCIDGNFQPEQASKYLPLSKWTSTLKEENPYAPLLQRIEELAAANSDTKLAMVSKARSNASDEKASEFIDELTKKFSELRAKREIFEKEIAGCKREIGRFSNFIGLGIDLQELFGCEYIDFRFGHLPKENYDRFIMHNSNPYLLFVKCSEDATDYWGVYCAPHNKVVEADRIFARLHFEPVTMNFAKGTPQQIVDILKSNIDKSEKQIKELEEESKRQWTKIAPRCNEIYTSLVLHNNISELRRYAVVDESQFFYYTGWIPVEFSDELRKRLEKINAAVTDEANRLVLDSESLNPKDTPPIRLKNPRIFRPYEYFVNMYGLPSHSDIDVTPFMAITYTLLFGIMFADVGQGLVLAILGFLGWKIKKMPLARILVMCGAASAVFGFVFGSVFGYEEMLDPLYHKLGMAGKPLSVMDSINTVLLFAIGIGVTLVVVAMLLSIVKHIKQKQFGEALFSENGVTGILFYLCAVAFAVAFMGGKRVLPNSVLFTVMGICAVILYLKQIIIAAVERKPELMPKKLGDYFMQSVFELIEYVLSYFSNTVSFLRVGAFVIVHASMMMVVFTLGSEGKNIPVIIIGNIVVIALEGLLTGIQGLRLEFYEMFSRFYEGSGRPFTSVKIEFAKKQVKQANSKKSKKLKKNEKNEKIEKNRKKLKKIQKIQKNKKSFRR